MITFHQDVLLFCEPVEGGGHSLLLQTACLHWSVSPLAQGFGQFCLSRNPHCLKEPGMEEAAQTIFAERRGGVREEVVAKLRFLRFKVGEASACVQVHSEHRGALKVDRKGCREKEAVPPTHTQQS